MRTNTSVAFAVSIFLLLPSAASATDITTIQPGDTIALTVTLNTTDPNENGEGEPVVVQANGTNIGVNFNYGIPQTFTYTASAQTTISYFIQGADGDESASVSFIKNATPSPVSQLQKDVYHQTGIVVGAIGLGLRALGGTQCNGACTTAGNIAAGLSLALSLVDPPDPNFTVIAKPTQVTLPSNITLGTQFSTDSIRAAALASALVTSINRYQGAVAAGDGVFQGLQLGAVNDYVAQLNALLGQLPPDILAFVDELKRLGIQANLSATNILGLEQQVAANAINGDSLSILQQLFTASDIKQIQQILFVQDINKIAGSYPNQLSNFAADLSSVAVPGPIAGAGLPGLVAACGGLLALARRRRKFVS
jgi:hypothetical protein